MTRVVLMGTPQFAVPTLEALVASQFDVVAVVTQPDRPTGRGALVSPPAVKKVAMALGLPVLQPASLRSPDAIALLRSFTPGLIVVVAFGQILRRAVLDLPPLGCLNVHPSLLPKLRGASPIQAAIRAGEPETGVSIMLMNERMDAGPVVAQVSAPILADDTAATLGERLARLGAELLVTTIRRWESGAIVPRDQDESEATFCKPLTKDDANIDWFKSAEQIARDCRANTPWPGCQSLWRDRQLRLIALTAHPDWRGSDPPGTVILLDGSTSRQPIVGVSTGVGAVVLGVLQLAGKRPVPVAEFLRGQPALVGARLAPTAAAVT